jgi:hypothetical protein
MSGAIISSSKIFPMKKISWLFALLAYPVILFSQLIPVNDREVSLKYSFVSGPNNRIFNPAKLYPFFARLSSLKDSSEKIVSIVHIGDSHIQADFLSGTVRSRLQNFFGNAGRGLIFPYQLAQSNAPSDIGSSSNTRWSFNRIAHPEIPIDGGVSGFVIQTNNPQAHFTISLKDMKGVEQGFNRMKIFASQDATTEWVLRTDEEILLEPVDSGSAFHVQLKEQISTAHLSLKAFEENASFYGVSLENSKPGILYHTIGVNGARFDHYNGAQLFWQQLPELKADLYIISLGTNEAQASSVNAEKFKTEMQALFDRLKKISPNASLLFTTAPDSYKKGRSNATLKQVNELIALFCDQNQIPIWNLYKASNGFGSAYSWNMRKLMSRDKVHFTADGYRLQGNLFFNAFAKCYNDFLSMKKD